MADSKRYVAFAFGLIGICGTLLGIHGGPGVAQEPNAALALGSGVVGGVSLGWYQHARDGLENDERYMAINYRAGYVAFWAVFWFLFVFAMAGIGEGDGDATSALPIDAHSIVMTAMALGFASLLVSKAWYRRQF
ncbi:hypothetical protein HTZ84_05495 [Haloterrigena sp. SYSU A558-1]|uniref:DUF2178 domain-containing protein n=1 Tax=Haloterrigena gelatinilytica TaxID=2741724 RepID=A0ABX2L673_9EURY|nr:hypothetical protein [Haloterrigena gelatinilytica]NUC71769.1 hypothetical protein [Haloterrigena gelatinilytica]